MTTNNSQFTQSSSELGSSRIYRSDNRLKKVRTETEIQEWLIASLTKQLEINLDELDEIDITLTFDSYGIDSASAVGLSGELEEWLGCEFAPTLLYHYPTIESLAKYLAEYSANNVLNFK